MRQQNTSQLKKQHKIPQEPLGNRQNLSEEIIQSEEAKMIPSLRKNGNRTPLAARWRGIHLPDTDTSSIPGLGRFHATQQLSLCAPAATKSTRAHLLHAPGACAPQEATAVRSPHAQYEQPPRAAPEKAPAEHSSSTAKSNWLSCAECSHRSRYKK